MTLNEVTLTGTLGTAAAGAQATLTPVVWTEYPAGPQTLPPIPQPQVLDQDGHFSVSLTATDNSGLVPSTWYWSIVYTGIPGVAPYGFSFYLPYSGGADQDVSALDPLQPVPSVILFMLAPTGTPTAGQVPVATGAGQASAWGNVLSNPMTTAGDMITGGASGAAQRLAGNTSATRQFLLSQGTGTAAQTPAWSTLQADDIPSLPYVPTSALPLAISSGGTGQGSQQAAINALAGSTASGQYLRGSGSNVQMSAIQAADVPTLNQNTTGTAANITDTLDQVPAPAASVSMASHKIVSLANGSVSSDAAAYGQTPAGGNTATIGQGGTGQTSASAAYSALSPMTSTGDIEYESAPGTASRLPGNISAVRNFLTQTGTGSASAAPAWGLIAAGDLPAATTTQQGAVEFDSSASDIQPAGTAASAGGTVATKAVYSDHIHLGFFAGLFGSGSDGAITLNGSTTPSGFSLAGSTYTLTRDVMPTSLTINSGVTLQMSGWRVFCKGPVVNNGTISGAANNGTGANSSGNGGAATTAASVGGGIQGGAGTTSTGSNGGGGSISAAAGAGGAGSSGSGGQAGSAISNQFTYYSSTPWPAVTAIIPLSGTSHTTNGASGGGGGGGDGTNFGGGAGSGGSIGVFTAYSFTNNGTISFLGGNGGSPATGNCGGGGGGAGGILYLITLAAWTNSGTATFTGGNGGTGHGSGSNGGNGSAGQAVNVVVS